MSGGSFNYLCSKEADDLFQSLEDLHDMARTLTEIGAHDAAAETEAIIAYIQHSKRQVNARRERLADLWQAVEWWKSADWSRETVDKFLAKYRGQ